MATDYYDIIFEGKGVRTTGFAKFCAREISIPEFPPECETEIRDLVELLFVYASGSVDALQPGHTMNYGLWILKFQEVNGILEIGEFNPIEQCYKAGLDRSVRARRIQVEACEKYRSAVNPPLMTKMAAISNGVLEGVLPVQGVRYPSPSHMSGWWFTTDKYDGDIKSIKNVHIYHVVEARPELVPLMGLDYGFRVEVSESDSQVRHDAWFDAKVLES